MRPRRRVALVVEYDGTCFSGFQAQVGRPAGRPTVQDALAEAVERATGARARILAAGRTDAGVHALGQVVCFDTESPIPAARFGPALNRHLPEGLVVRRAWEVAPSFHPRYGAVSKEYRYLILNRAEPSALARRRAWWIGSRLDDQAMAEAALGLTGRHDFAAFVSSGSSARSTVRTVHSLQVEKRPPWLVIIAEADGFLYRMVRRLVGGLVQVGLGRMSPAELVRRLDEPERRPPVPTAPPWGLYLVRVRYPSGGPGEASSEDGPTACLGTLIDPMAWM